MTLSLRCVSAGKATQAIIEPIMAYFTDEYMRYYIMAGHAIVVVEEINLLFYHGNAVILTLW